MGSPISRVPDTATADGLTTPTASAGEDWAAIVQALEQAGILRLVRALLEQRQPVAEQLIMKLDTEPTKQGIKNALTLAMGWGRISEETVKVLVEAVAQGLRQAQKASHSPAADKMSIWALVGLLKNPDIARALHYLMGFLEGIGRALNDAPPPEAEH